MQSEYVPFHCFECAMVDFKGKVISCSILEGFSFNEVLQDWNNNPGKWKKQHFVVKVSLPISVRPTQPFGPRPPLGGKKIFQKEQPVMDKKPSLSIHIELYIIYPFPNNKYWRTFFSFFHLRKVILPDFSLLGFKRKRIWIWKRKNFLGRRKKSLLVRPCHHHQPMTPTIIVGGGSGEGVDSDGC